MPTKAAHLWCEPSLRALIRGTERALLSLWLGPRRVGLIATQSFGLTARPGLSEGSGLSQRAGLGQRKGRANHQLTLSSRRMPNLSTRLRSVARVIPRSLAAWTWLPWVSLSASITNSRSTAGSTLIPPWSRAHRKSWSTRGRMSPVMAGSTVGASAASTLGADVQGADKEGSAGVDNP